MAPKRKVLEKSATAAVEEVAKIGTMLAEKSQGLVLREIQDLLVSKPEVAQQVLFLIKSGSLEKRHPNDADDDNLLPQSCNKFRLLSSHVQKQILFACEENLASRLDRIKPAMLLHLLSFALNVDTTCALLSKNKTKLMAECVKRYDDAGRRLENMKWTSDGPMWTECGYFRVQVGGQHGKLVKHIGGLTVNLPADLASMDWEIKDNYNQHKAMLQAGLVAIPVQNLFAKEGLTLPVPLLLHAVPAGLTTPTRSNSGAGSAASSAGSRTNSASRSPPPRFKVPRQDPFEGVSTESEAPPPPEGTGSAV